MVRDNKESLTTNHTLKHQSYYTCNVLFDVYNIYLCTRNNETHLIDI